MSAFHQNHAPIEQVVNFVEEMFREEYERTGRRTTISFPTFSTPTHIRAILHNDRYSAYKYISLPSVVFADLNELEVLLRDSAISSVPEDGELLAITLTNPTFRSILYRPVDTRGPDFRTLVFYKVAMIDLHLWSDVLRPFVCLAFCDVNEFTPLRRGKICTATSWASTLSVLKMWNVSIPRDTFYRIISSCSMLDVLILGHLHLTLTEAPPDISDLVEHRAHDLRELSLFNFPALHMGDFLKLIRKSSRVQISVHNLRKLVIVMDPTLNSVLSADLKNELIALLKDNLFRRTGDSPSMLEELRVVSEVFGGYILGNSLPRISLPTLLRHSRLSKVTLDVWETPTMPIQMLGRIVDNVPIHAALNIVFSTSVNVSQELEILDGAIVERYERGRPFVGERPPTAFLIIQTHAPVRNETAKQKAQMDSIKNIFRESISKGYLAIRDSI